MMYVNVNKVTDYKRVRQIVEEKLEDYNMEPKVIPMNLAMFRSKPTWQSSSYVYSLRFLCFRCRDAVMHVCRIHRVLVQPRGNLMLVGVGGSGRSSLTRLATFIANMNVFTIEITKNYRSVTNASFFPANWILLPSFSISEFREDIKKLYMSAGCDNKKSVFLFNETQVGFAPRN
jgi:dynein heavy chain